MFIFTIYKFSIFTFIFNIFILIFVLNINFDIFNTYIYYLIFFLFNIANKSMIAFASFIEEQRSW